MNGRVELCDNHQKRDRRSRFALVTEYRSAIGAGCLMELSDLRRRKNFHRFFIRSEPHAIDLLRHRHRHH